MPEKLTVKKMRIRRRAAFFKSENRAYSTAYTCILRSIIGENSARRTAKPGKGGPAGGQRNETRRSKLGARGDEVSIAPRGRVLVAGRAAPRVHPVLWRDEAALCTLADCSSLLCNPVQQSG